MYTAEREQRERIENRGCKEKVIDTERREKIKDGVRNQKINEIMTKKLIFI